MPDFFLLIFNNLKNIYRTKIKNLKGFEVSVAGNKTKVALRKVLHMLSYSTLASLTLCDIIGLSKL